MCRIIARMLEGEKAQLTASTGVRLITNNGFGV